MLWGVGGKDAVSVRFFEAEVLWLLYRSADCVFGRSSWAIVFVGKETSWGVVDVS